MLALKAFVAASGVLLVGAQRSVRRSAVLTADPGTYSGEAEAALVLKELRNPHNITSAFIHCADVIEGSLKGHEVVVATTGIGHDVAASCSVEILSYYNNEIEHVLYMGTSGWTPRKGGFFNPAKDTTCSAPPAPSQLGAGLTGIGDVCISPHTFLFNCGFCQWGDRSHGECAAPKCNNHDQYTVFGPCEFAGADVTLADALKTASEEVQFDTRPAVLQDYLSMYWNATWDGIAPGARHLPAATPTVLDGRQCAEAASYNLWSGLPQDYLCREYLAGSITRNYGTPTTPEDVTCVSAMEGPGWMRVFLDTAKKIGRAIPVANVRGASNYDHPPFVRDAAGDLQRNDAWVKRGSDEEFVKLGYQYAIASVSKIVLKFYENKA